MGRKGCEMSHLTIASTKGMKAGLNAYMTYLSRSGLPTVQAKLAEYESLRKRQRLAHYCNEFGPQVTAEQATMRNKPRNARVVGVQVFEDEPTELSDEIAQARARLAELEAAAKAAKAPKPAKVEQERKPNVWHPWAVRKHNIPTKVGAEFTYKGKRRTSTFKVTKVTRDGSVESIRVK